MLLKIREFLNKDSIECGDALNVGIVPYNDAITNFKELNVVYRDIGEDIPEMDLCLVDNSIPKDILEKIQEKTDILISLGSCITFSPDLVIPGVNVSDEFLNIVLKALVEDDLEYLKPLLAMTRENDFRTKTIMVIAANELCVGCSGCAFICPQEAIKMERTRPSIDFSLCVHCGCCFATCPKSWNLPEEVEAWC